MPFLLLLSPCHQLPHVLLYACKSINVRHGIKCEGVARSTNFSSHYAVILMITSYKGRLSARHQCPLVLHIPTLVPTSATASTPVLAPYRVPSLSCPSLFCLCLAPARPAPPVLLLPSQPLTARASAPHVPASRVRNMTYRYFYLNSVSLTRPSVTNPDPIPVLAQ